MIELKPKLYAVTVADQFDCVVNNFPASGYCAQHALEEAIQNGQVYPQTGAILTAYIKPLEGSGAVFKIEFGAD